MNKMWWFKCCPVSGIWHTLYANKRWGNGLLSAFANLLRSNIMLSVQAFFYVISTSINHNVICDYTDNVFFSPSFQFKYICPTTVAKDAYYFYIYIFCQRLSVLWFYKTKDNLILICGITQFFFFQYRYVIFHISFNILATLRLD